MKWKSSIRFQLFIQVSIIIMICVAVLLLANSQLLPYYYEYSERNSLADAVKEAGALDENDEDFNQNIADIERKYDVSLQIYTITGRLVYPNLMAITANGQTLNDWIEYFANYQRKVSVLEQEQEKGGALFQIQQDINTGVQYLSYVAVVDDAYQVEAFTPRSTIELNASIADSLVWKLPRWCWYLHLFSYSGIRVRSPIPSLR